MTLQAPSYVPFMEYSTNRELKEKLWRASNSLCLGGEFDNTENIKRMVNLRLKIANLLGYPTYADYVLADRMAENAQTVNAFLDELLAQTKEYAVKDYNTIGEYARSQGFEGEVMPWDMAYYSEKYRHEKYELNEELVKPYLQLDSVKRGVFLLANKLYGLNFTPNPEVPVYHPEVTAYDVTDKGRSLPGGTLPRLLPPGYQTRRGLGNRVPERFNRRGTRNPPAGVAGDELHQADRYDSFTAYFQ